MNRRRLAMVASLSFALIPGLIGMKQGQAQAPKTAYPSMAPLDQYLMADRNAEIALARSAAPEAISGEARFWSSDAMATKLPSKARTVLLCCRERVDVAFRRSGILESQNFEVQSVSIRRPRDPFCRLLFKRTEMVLAGRTKAEIIEGNKAAFEKGELPPLEPGAMSYMMSKEAYLTDHGDHNLAHLMFYAPPLDGKAWGADLPKSPVMLIPQFKGAQPIDVFIVPVGRWSDGSAAPVM